MPRFQVQCGKPQKISLPLLIISAIGWIFFIGGFIAYHAFVSLSDSRGLLRIPHWIFAVLGLGCYIVHTLHLTLSHRATAITAHGFAISFIAFGGAVIYADIVFLTGRETAFQAVAAELAGGAVATVFMAIDLVVWPCYSDSGSRSGERETDEHGYDSGSRSGERETDEHDYDSPEVVIQLQEMGGHNPNTEDNFQENDTDADRYKPLPASCETKKGRERMGSPDSSEDYEVLTHHELSHYACTKIVND